MRSSSSRIEDGADTGLRFALWEGGDADAIAGEPLRASRPGDAVPIHGPGWFSFDFTPVAASRGRVYTLGVEAAGGVALMAHRGLGSRLKVAGRGVARIRSRSAPWPVARRPSGPTSTRCARASRRSRRGSIKGRCTSASRSPRRATWPASCARSASRAATARADGIRFMTLDVFKAVEPMLSRALTINAFGLGEPFLSPHFMPILRRSRALNADAVVFCSTNGVTYSERTITAVVAERLVNVLQISVDGATKETYEHVRVGGRFEQLMKNLRFLQREKLRLRARVPSTKVQMVIMRPNMHEVVDVTRSMIDHGIDVLRLDTVKDHPELEITGYDDVRRLNDQLQEAIHLCTAHHISVEGTLLTEIEPMLDRRGGARGHCAGEAVEAGDPVGAGRSEPHARRRHAGLHRPVGELHARRQRRSAPVLPLPEGDGLDLEGVVRGRLERPDLPRRAREPVHRPLRGPLRPLPRDLELHAGSGDPRRLPRAARRGGAAGRDRAGRLGLGARTARRRSA